MSLCVLFVNKAGARATKAFHTTAYTMDKHGP